MDKNIELRDLPWKASLWRGSIDLIPFNLLVPCQFQKWGSTLDYQQP